MSTVDFYQHLLITSDISTFSPTKALGHHDLSQAAHKELSDSKKCVRLWHGMDLIPAFGLIYLALGSHSELWNFKNHAPKKWSAFYWGGVKKTYSNFSMFDTWPDTGKHSFSYMWLSMTRFE